MALSCRVSTSVTFSQSADCSIRDSITRASAEVLGIGFSPDHDGSWLMRVSEKEVGRNYLAANLLMQSGGLRQIDRAAAEFLSDGTLENVEALIELAHRGRERHHALDHLVVRAGALDDQAVAIGPRRHGRRALGIGATHADHHAATAHIDEMGRESVHHHLQPPAQVLALRPYALGEGRRRPVMLKRRGRRHEGMIVAAEWAVVLARR